MGACISLPSKPKAYGWFDLDYARREGAEYLHLKDGDLEALVTHQTDSPTPPTVQSELAGELDPDGQIVVLRLNPIVFSKGIWNEEKGHWRIESTDGSNLISHYHERQIVYRDPFAQHFAIQWEPLCGCLFTSSTIARIARMQKKFSRSQDIHRGIVNS